MYLFGYQSETGMTHFTLNDTKSRGKCISRFSLVGAGGGGRGEASDMYQASES